MKDTEMNEMVTCKSNKLRARWWSWIEWLNIINISILHKLSNKSNVIPIKAPAGLIINQFNCTIYMKLEKQESRHPRKKEKKSWKREKQLQVPEEPRLRVSASLSQPSLPFLCYNHQLTHLIIPRASTSTTFTILKQEIPLTFCNPHSRHLLLPLLLLLTLQQELREATDAVSSLFMVPDGLCSLLLPTPLTHCIGHFSSAVPVASPLPLLCHSAPAILNSDTALWVPCMNG